MKRFYVGCSKAEGNNSLFVVDFSYKSKTFSMPRKIFELRNPSYLLLSDDGSRLYVIDEVSPSVLFILDITEEIPREINHLTLPANEVCHLCFSADKKSIYASSYGSGKLLLISIEGDVLKIADIFHADSAADHLTGSKPSRIHSCILEKNGILAADLGKDRILRFVSDDTLKNHPTQPEFVLKPGSGPRHMALHPSGKYLFISLELSNSIAVLYIDEYSHWQLLQYLSLGESGKCFPAHIDILDSGDYLYVSNRGEGTMLCFSIDKSGIPKQIQSISSGGSWPRHFLVDSGKRMLLTANQTDGNICAFEFWENKKLNPEPISRVFIENAAFIAEYKDNI